eukprot:scaffold1208_cov163-Ochromonas_danica.AAC.16
MLDKKSRNILLIAFFKPFLCLTVVFSQSPFLSASHLGHPVPGRVSPVKISAINRNLVKPKSRLLDFQPPPPSSRCPTRPVAVHLARGVLCPRPPLTALTGRLHRRSQLNQLLCLRALLPVLSPALPSV